MTFTYKTIANLTPQEFNERYEAFRVFADEQLEVAKGLAEDEVHTSKIGIDLWDRKSLDSDCIYGQDMEDTIDTITNFQIEISEYRNRRGFRVENKDSIDGDYEDSYAEIGYVGYQASWLEPIEKISDGTLNSEFRELVKTWLAPEGLTGWKINAIDCKLLTLFKDGKIDWNTLRTLVYSDCDI